MSIKKAAIVKKGVVEPERKSPTEPILSTFYKLLRLSVYERLKKNIVIIGERQPKIKNPIDRLTNLSLIISTNLNFI